VSTAHNAWIGFDVGGQSAKAVLLGSNAEKLGEAKRPTGLATDAAALINALADLGVVLSKSAPSDCEIAETVGVGIAGVMASDGVLAGSPNLPRMVGTQVREALSLGLRRSVVIDNDANCAALAESWHGGAAAGCRDFLLVTLGSGIGSGLVLGGALYHGATGYACELGHTIIVAGGRLCGCGNRGCLEAYVSETAARQLAVEAGEALSAKVEKLVNERKGGHAHALFTLAEAGDKAAMSVVDGMVRMLGSGLGSAVNLLDVPAIVLGGGIAPGVLAREPQLRVAMQSSLFARPVEAVKILGALRGSDAGAVGAARLAMLRDEAEGEVR
jgi:glucokinase